MTVMLWLVLINYDCVPPIYLIVCHVLKYFDLGAFKSSAKVLCPLFSCSGSSDHKRVVAIQYLTWRNISEGFNLQQCCEKLRSHTLMICFVILGLMNNPLIGDV